MRINVGENGGYYNANKYGSFQELERINSMRGAKRVVVFCMMTTVLPTALIIIPLYLRHIAFADVTYTVAESDVVEITEGMSSIFCAAHTLQMNSSFNAFQLTQAPKFSSKRKHVRLKKSMTLPDDTLEYWGFYLLKGATVLLKVCSRYKGSSILVVRGEKNLRTCGLTEHNLRKFGAKLDQEHNQVKVTFESAQEIDDGNNTKLNQQFEEIDGNVAAEEEDPNSLVGVPLSLSRTDRSSYSVPEHTKNKTHKKKGQKSHRKFIPKQQELHRLQQELQADKDIKLVVKRPKRTAHLFDRRIEHGGNALNYSSVDSSENSFSSFESDLLNCYNGQILLTEVFPPSELCTDVHYLEKGDRMKTVHNVASDGYYYYIFYSDNENTLNDVHAIFDIYKPTLKFANISSNKSCINKTVCTFPISFLSEDPVIVEVPMRDGIEHEDDDFTFLISTCHPRMAIYIIFPIAVLFLILGCAFI